MDDLTQDRLKALVSYNKATGEFRRMVQSCGGFVPPSGHVLGKATDANKNKHIQIRIDGVRYYAHRLAWLYVTGAFPEHEIDHKDGNPRNNAFYNLREVTRQQNASNRPHPSGKRFATGTTKFRGKFRARISFDGKVLELGLFETQREAHAAYVNAMHDHYGDQVVITPHSKGYNIARKP